ncbi:MAG: hypothetical protein AAB389_03850 [Patescibacteria group bacterium]
MKLKMFLAVLRQTKGWHLFSGSSGPNNREASLIRKKRVSEGTTQGADPLLAVCRLCLRKHVSDTDVLSAARKIGLGTELIKRIQNASDEVRPYYHIDRARILDACGLTDQEESSSVLVKKALRMSI